MQMQPILLNWPSPEDQSRVQALGTLQRGSAPNADMWEMLLKVITSPTKTDKCTESVVVPLSGQHTLKMLQDWSKAFYRAANSSRAVGDAVLVYDTADDFAHGRMRTLLKKLSVSPEAASGLTKETQAFVNLSHVNPSVRFLLYCALPHQQRTLLPVLSNQAYATLPNTLPALLTSVRAYFMGLLDTYNGFVKDALANKLKGAAAADAARRKKMAAERAAADAPADGAGDSAGASSTTSTASKAASAAPTTPSPADPPPMLVELQAQANIKMLKRDKESTKATGPVPLDAIVVVDPALKTVEDAWYWYLQHLLRSIHKLHTGFYCTSPTMWLASQLKEWLKDVTATYKELCNTTKDTFGRQSELYHCITVSTPLFDLLLDFVKNTGATVKCLQASRHLSHSTHLTILQTVMKDKTSAVRKYKEMCQQHQAVTLLCTHMTLQHWMDTEYMDLSEEACSKAAATLVVGPERLNWGLCASWAAT